jgi:hypothetical protein
MKQSRSLKENLRKIAFRGILMVISLSGGFLLVVVLPCLASL